MLVCGVGVAGWQIFYCRIWNMEQFNLTGNAGVNIISDRRDVEKEGGYLLKIDGITLWSVINKMQKI